MNERKDKKEEKEKAGHVQWGERDSKLQVIVLEEKRKEKRT